jgi:serine/threonine protein kinase/WD40 repeat protein
VPDPDTNPPATAPDRTQPSGDGTGIRFGSLAVTGEIGTLGRFRIKKELGRGGMGAVFLALDTRLERQVALKVMLPQAAVNQTAKDRFIREARAAARISHDNVIAILDADEIDGVPFIALPFLQGYPLDQYLKKKGNPALPQALRIGREIANGLAAAHDLGVVHRDVKPGNIWLEAPNGRVKILDFGLAKPQDEEAGGKELTHSGAVMGTPAYMAPEQAAGQKVDHRADLYSLGTVLYRLVAGKTPFERPGGMMALLTALAIEPPPRVEEFNAEVPPALAELIHQLLEKNRDLRPQSAKEVAKRLAAIRDNPGASGPDVSLAPVSLASQPQSNIPVTLTPASAFADIDADEPTERESRIKQPKPAIQAPKSRATMFAAIGTGVLAIVVGGYFVVKMLSGPAKAPEVVEKKPEKPAPEPSKGSNGIAKVVPTVPKPAPAEISYVPWQPVNELTSIPSAPRGPLDDLNPAKIPAAERFPWQPKELVAVVGSHSGKLETFYALSPNGKLIAMISPGSGLKIVEADTFSLKLWDRTVDYPSAVCAFSPDGRWLAVPSNDTGGKSEIRLYDVRIEPKLIRTVAPGRFPCQFASLAFSGDGSTLVTGEISGSVCLWNLNGPADLPQVAIELKDEDVSLVDVARNGRTIAARLQNRFQQGPVVAIRIWDVEGSKAVVRGTVPSSEKPVSFALSTDGRRLVTGHDDRMALWNVAGAEPMLMESINEPWSWVRSLENDQDEFFAMQSNFTKPALGRFGDKLERGRDLPRNAVAVSGDGRRSLHNDEASIHRVRDELGNVVAFSGEAVATHNVAPALGIGLMTFFPNDRARLWTARDGAFQPEVPKAIRGSTANPFTRSATSPDGMAIAGLDVGRLVAFKVIGSSLWPLTESTHGNVAQFVWAPDSKSILLVNDQNALYRWNPHETDSVGDKLLDLGYPLSNRIGQLQLSPNSKIVAVASPERGVELIDISDPKAPRRTKLDLGPDFQPINLGAVAFSAGNRFLYVPTNSGLLRVDLTSPTLPTDIAAVSPNSGLSAVLVSPDGRRIVTSGNYQFGGIEWWDATEFHFKRLGGYVGVPPAGLGFAPDGRHFMLEQHGTVYVLRIDGSITTTVAPPAPAPPAPIITTEPSKPAPAPPPPKVPAKWLELTDGKTLADWDQFQTAGWTLKNNMLEANGSAQGWVGTKKEYEDFEFEFEFKMPPRGNSGVFLRAWDNGQPTGSEFVEIQLLDDAAYLPMTVPNTRHGSVFKKIAPNPVPPFKLNQWNKGKIEVVGKHVTVTIGGVKCIDADVDFPRMKGRVGLQHYRTSVEFRSVRIREK